MKNNPRDTSIPYRPLGILKDILNDLGIEISYSYEDLIFTEHNHFLLQFGDEGKDLLYYHNSEEEGTLTLHYQKLAEHLHSREFDLSYRGKYTVSENDDGTLSIAFQNE